jgi:hypothetical protein
MAVAVEAEQGDGIRLAVKRRLGLSVPGWG